MYNFSTNPEDGVIQTNQQTNQGNNDTSLVEVIANKSPLFCLTVNMYTTFDMTLPSTSHSF